MPWLVSVMIDGAVGRVALLLRWDFVTAHGTPAAKPDILELGWSSGPTSQ